MAGDLNLIRVRRQVPTITEVKVMQQNQKPTRPTRRQRDSIPPMRNAGHEANWTIAIFTMCCYLVIIAIQMSPWSDSIIIVTELAQTLFIASNFMTVMAIAIIFPDHLKERELRRKMLRFRNFAREWSYELPMNLLESRAKEYGGIHFFKKMNGGFELYFFQIDVSSYLHPYDLGLVIYERIKRGGYNYDSREIATALLNTSKTSSRWTSTKWLELVIAGICERDSKIADEIREELNDLNKPNMPETLAA